MRIEFDPSLGRLDGDTDPGLVAHKPYLQLKAIHRLATAVTRAATLDEIFDAAIQGLVSALAITRAAILTWGEDGRMHFRASRNLSQGYMEAADGHSPWQRDVIEPEPILMADPLREPLGEALKAVIRSEGIHGLAFIPLLYKGRLLGKLMVYADHPGAIHPDAVQLAQTLAGHVAFALGRKQAEAEHRATEMRLTRMLRNLPVMLYDAETPSSHAATWVSENSESVTGYTLEQLKAVENLWAERLHPADAGLFSAAMERTRATGSAVVEYRWLRKDGTWVWFLDHMERAEIWCDSRRPSPRGCRRARRSPAPRWSPPAASRPCPRHARRHCRPPRRRQCRARRWPTPARPGRG